ncbi:MAG TPA: cysteine desulfurase family protein [Candidatus Woesearchaeota archaeon]|nr:cysteine desulfurase family protein [Candidatus Woesearchaeota archaeon]
MKIYADNASTTKLDPCVLEEMLPFLKEDFGNPSSLHSKGLFAQRAVDKARLIISESIGVNPEEIIFTSGATESDNLAIKGIAYANKDSTRKKIITTKIEHDAVLKTFEQLSLEGFETVFLNVDKEGFVKLDELKKELTEKTLLVSIIHANNEIGTIQDIKTISELCHKVGAIFHTDATQSYTKIPINIKDLNIDLMTMNAHKLHGPKGVGALYIKEGLKIKPLFGGGGQEFKIRSGTYNVAGIVGFGKAVEIQTKQIEKNSDYIKSLRDELYQKLSKIENSKINGPTDLSKEKRLVNNLNIRFSGIEGEAMLFRLDDLGIMVSTASACSSQSLKPSHVLMACGLSHEQAHGSLRFSLSKFNHPSEIPIIATAVEKVVTDLRKLSPLVGLRKQKVN